MIDEYKARDKQIERLIENRKKETSAFGVWDYNAEVSKQTNQQPFKYQSTEPGVFELDPMNELIYNEAKNPEDTRLFNSDWGLAPFTEKILNPPEVIPSRNYLQTLKKDNREDQIERFYGRLEMQGYLEGKSNEIQYTRYFYNLRSNAISFYKNNKPNQGERELFFIILNEKTYDYLSDSMDFFLLKGQTKNIKIHRTSESRDLIKTLENKLLYYAFRGAYAFRNEVPSYKVEDYLKKQIDTIGPINFHDESKFKETAKKPYYRETVGAFFGLLEKVSKNRNNKAGQITYPRWLKQQFRNLPQVQTWLSCNITPPLNPLLSLKIKVNQNQKEGMLHGLKYIFPYLQSRIKRSLSIYESQINDEEMARILHQINYPFYAIGFPRNKISERGLYYAIEKSSDLYNQIFDFGYNSRLITIGGSKLMKVLNDNPVVKKLYLRGCYIAESEENAFFESLKANLALLELEVDYMDHYNDNMVEHLENFEAIIE